jgi:hypothetical protein
MDLASFASSTSLFKCRHARPHSAELSFRALDPATSGQGGDASAERLDVELNTVSTAPPLPFRDDDSFARQGSAV